MFDDYDDVPRNPAGICIIALLCGAAGVVIAYFMSDLSYVGVILGAIGMVAGGYGINLANYVKTDTRLQFMALAGVGIMLSVIAFMFGLANLVG